jgi:hypothetical protein
LNIAARSGDRKVAIGAPAPDIVLFRLWIVLIRARRLVDPRYSEFVEALGQEIAQ